MRELLDTYRAISLEEMKGIKLMNRIDTKFVTSVARLEQLLAMARAKYRVQESRGRRIFPYATLYFDTPTLAMYTMHHNGRLPRQKVRLRSYVASHQGFLEVKTKDNHRRTLKRRVSFPAYVPGSMPQSLRLVPGQVSETALALVTQHLHVPASSVVPQLENSFNRITLVNDELTERLTIDTSLKFHNFATRLDCDLTGLVIIELKRDGRRHSPVLEMLRQLRIMPMGFSKYCMGTAFTRSDARKGSFKERMRTVERIIDRKIITS